MKKGGFAVTGGQRKAKILPKTPLKAVRALRREVIRRPIMYAMDSNITEM